MRCNTVRFLFLPLLGMGCATMQSPECEPVGSTVHAVPDRCEVAQVMRSLAREISRCSVARGTVTVALIFASSGAATGARAMASDEEASETSTRDPNVLKCVGDLAAQAKLRPFIQPQFIVKYPYRLGPADVW
jgi:hypothetical protein